MAADATLWRDGPVAAPMDYTVPQSGELIPKSITALIDGTNAAVDFFPVVQVLDPSGHVLSTSKTADSLAAGESASVTWFPGSVAAPTSVTPVSGAWTQVFHFDVSATGAPTSIDTSGGSAWSNADNNIFGIFMGQSATSQQNERLLVTVNGDSTSRYGWSVAWSNKYIVGQSPAAAMQLFGNVTDLSGVLGQVGGTGDTLGTTGLQFWIPRTFQSSESAKIISTGGYAGLVSAAVQTAVTTYIFSTITRLTLRFQSGSAFQPGSSLTLWTV